MTETIRWESGEDGIVVLTLDDPEQQANTMNERYQRSMAQTVERLYAERENITGVILTSAKKTFFAGGDLKDLGRIQPENAQQAFDASQGVKDALRKLETLGRPVVAALNGAALGGGLEIALATHHRIALDNPKARFGLPEVTLGLLPGGGGVVRTVRLLGIVDALMKVLLQGKQMRAQEAKEAGLIDEIVATPEEMLARAREWIKANPEAVQPWDVKGFKIPGGTPSNPKFAANLPAFPANLRKQLKGAPMPAPRNILAAAVEGAQVDFDTALRIETRYFVDLATGQVAKNMIKAFFFDLQHANSGGSRPKDVPAWQATKVAVLGAGMMGAGIAYVCAKSGMEVVLKDVSAESAEKGKAYSQKILDKAVARGRSTPAARDEVLARIRPTADAADLDGCDLVIEAVFENTSLKHKVFSEIQDVVAPHALLASNTSTLPITGLAEGVKRRKDFVGLHFFSPVDKMPLVEIVVGEQTSDEALARAVDVVRQIRKTPIVVNDSRGFFTSRVIGTFLNEGVAMLAEGYSASTIEQVSSQAGYPAPVLQLMDELTLTLGRKIRNEAKQAVIDAGGTWTSHPAETVIDRMVEEFGREGRAAGAGFYSYVDGKRAGLWAGLKDAFPVLHTEDVPFQDLVERLLFIEALETVRCVEEGVITSVPDANIGSIMGIGFPPWTGGVLQYINGYEGGPKGFLARAEELAERYGDRFTPPALLRTKADTGALFD
ncbi:3-hydroxyacyl-CoA dehydrogenase NAD-binding domain-containing protein [Allokutzneria sp. A3M-2-11 16]|uniref:3-hydroxyacyl-CoA dehydrogenase NAD-binding domain-containing protein n=1 Tax=Allokutzneria sp. A3M-2-11 16 TaxID=2962043 RepID=UPI0020B81530|nr:3-hydroxyacyl-CoA dehydrogenase NAD-binding domain-containing protein [Allokutzneria sp. A3M-2-11 16]MCP3801573.1 3-hydroxyacyl-CoA dehydrogenase NAD-binding domain-containing protein [Allokutzneria sp. A3M-2-11 16]